MAPFTSKVNSFYDETLETDWNGYILNEISLWDSDVVSVETSKIFSIPGFCLKSLDVDRMDICWISTIYDYYTDHWVWDIVSQAN